MKLIMLSIYDSKAEAFITPFFSPTVAVGQRAFTQSCNDPKSNFCQHPGDFTLFELGEFDIETAEVTMLPAMKNHGLALLYQTTDLSESTARPIAELRAVHEAANEGTN